MIDRELANEAARNQLRAQVPDLTEAQVRHKGKMIAGAVLSTVQTPPREDTERLIAQAVTEGRRKFRDKAGQWTEQQARDAIFGEIVATLDARPEKVSREVLMGAFNDAIVLLDGSGLHDEGQANDFLADAMTRLLYGAVGQAGAVLDRDALAAHLASVRWDNAATRMDRQQFWSQRADEAIAATGARSEAEVKAEALREAAAEMRRILVTERKTLGGPADEWLLAWADRLT